MEFPEKWKEMKDLLALSNVLELVSVYRLSYLPEEQCRPRVLSVVTAMPKYCLPLGCP